MSLRNKNFPDRSNYTVAVILAGGNSTRMGKLGNKSWLEIDGVPVLAHTLMAYEACPFIREIHVVAHRDEFDRILELQKRYHITKLVRLTVGGATRQESAMHGFSQLPANARFVAIADAARCATTPSQIGEVCKTAYRMNCASAGHIVTDTLKKCNVQGRVTGSVDRTGVWQVQTPQVIHVGLYTAGLEKADREHLTVTDDESLVQAIGCPVELVECGAENIKITMPGDLELAKAILSDRKNRKNI